LRKGRANPSRDKWKSLMSAVPQCRVVTVHLFRGNRGALGQSVRKALDDHRHGRGPGPTPLGCLLYAGHTGVSVDYQPSVIWGFNPSIGKTPLWQAMQVLLNGNAYPGFVNDDTQVFATARKKRLNVLTFDVILPDPVFQDFETKLNRERNQSLYTYGFPDGDGDCNCATWLERLALPLISGSMIEFADTTATSRYPRRRFGQCI
jgi:hypothetical protein